MDKSNRRKKIILHGLQVRLIFVLAGLTIAISAILVVSLFFIIHHNMTSVSMSPEHMERIIMDSVWPVIMIALVLFVITIWTITIMTHRIYGPLYRLTLYIKKLVNGDAVDEIRFRKDDAIHGLQEVYNDLRKNLGRTLHYNYQEMIKIFYELENILDKMYNKKIKERELFNSLQKICSKIARALDITSDVIESEKK